MVPYIQRLVCLNIFISLLNPWARSELYTAIVAMEPLLKTNKIIMEDLNDYVVKEEKRLVVLKNYLEQYKVEHKQAMEDTPNYLRNPINAFTLIKRLTTDLDEINAIIKNGTDYIKNITMNHVDVKYPTLEDLVGAAQALTRLQVTYNLDVHDLAEGKLNGVAYSHPMSASDCIELFKVLYHLKDYTHSLAWSMETLRKYKEETTEEHSFTEADVLEYIACVHYKLGNLKASLEWSKKLLRLDPMHPRAAVNVPYFEMTIAEQEAASEQGFFSCINAFVRTALEWSKKLLHLDSEHTEQGAVNVIHIENVTAEQEAASKRPRVNGLESHNLAVTGEYAILKTKYEALCRGEMEINSGVAKRLFCRYLSETHPFLRLAPIKAEQVYIDPDVFVFHGVLSDDEIQLIKDLSMPRFEPAVVYDVTTGKFLAANYRVCKVAWFHDKVSQVVARVSQRVADMTGLSVEWADDLQVANYGIGGHYEPHFDFFEKKHCKLKLLRGNRIATALFYMSDVALGGATVFTELGLSVHPERGAALYWRNLHPSGEGDVTTRHGACPVLRGSKWVCTKWLHETGQELIEPCNLEYQREEMVRNILAPYRNRRDRMLQFKNNNSLN